MDCLKVPLNKGEFLEPSKVVRTKSVNGEFYNLVEWTIKSSDDKSFDEIPTSTTLVANEDKNKKSVCLWMTDEEVKLCCPFLCHEGIPNDSKNDASEFAESSVNDSEHFKELESDVSSLVKRARKQMESGQKNPAVNLSRTLQILSTYASFEMVSGVFKNSGALDLVLDLMFTDSFNTRQLAWKILRALAAHDSGSRAYVLLSLTKEEHRHQLVDKNDHFQHRNLVLEMFSETASSEEAQVVALESVQLPQVSSKSLFNLMKKYLRLTSLMGQEKSHTCHQFDWMFVDKEKSQSANIHKFNVAMVMSDLILTLSQIMGWKLEQIIDKEKLSKISEFTQPEKVRHGAMFPKRFRDSSIDKNLLATLLKPNNEHSSKNLRSSSSFDTKREYTDYLRSEINPDCWVKLSSKYPGVDPGEVGRFKKFEESPQSKVQVYWPMLEKVSSVELKDLVVTNAEGRSPSTLVDPENSLLWKLLSGMDYKIEKFYSEERWISEPCKSHGISQSDWWNFLFVASYMKEEVKSEIMEIIKKQYPHENHLSCVIPNHPTFLKVLDLVDASSIDERKRLLNIGGLIKCERNGTETLNENPSTSKVNLPEEKHTAGEKSALFSIIPIDCKKVDDIIVESDDVIKKRARAQEMGLRINLIADEEMSKKFTEILMKEENFKFANTMTSVFINNQHPNNLINLLADNHDNKDKVLMLFTYLAYVITSHKVPCLRNEKCEERTRFVSQLALPSYFHSVDVTIAYLNLVLACLSDNAQKPTNQDGDGLEVTFVNYDHLNIILKFNSFHSDLTPETNEDRKIILRKTTLCLSKLLLAAEFAESPSSHQCDHAFLVSVLFSILTGKTFGGNFMTLLLTPFHFLAESVKQCPRDEVYYEMSCIVCLILRKDKSKSFIMENEEMLKKINSMLAAVVGGKTRKMVLRWRGLMVSMKRKDILEDSIDDELVIDNFEVGSLVVSKSLEKLSTLLTDDTTEPDVGSRLGKIVDGILPTLKQGEISDLQLRSLKILQEFLEKYQDSSLVFDEKTWNLNLIYLSDILKKCANDLSPTVTNLSIEIANIIIHIFEILVEMDGDFSVNLCVLNTKENITKIQDKHGIVALTEKSSDLIKTLRLHEHKVLLNHRLLSVLLGSCISSSFECVDGARREDKLINVPLFRSLLDNLCKGSDSSYGEDKCWVKMEVSSNPRQCFRLTDRDPNTYWESNRSSGSHWIDVFMKKGVLVRKMTLTVAQEDSSYMPARVVVFGGTVAADATTQLSSVNVGLLTSKIVVLEDEKKFWPVIRVTIRRCQQGGIDTRIHGLEVSGLQPSLWPIFHEQLNTRTSLYYNVQCRMWLGEGCDVDRVLETPVRLNNALKHEQEFADSFLPTPESALVLGQACQSVVSGQILKVLFKERTIEENEFELNREPKTLFDDLIGRYLLQCRERTNQSSSKVRQLMRLLLDLDSAPSGEKPSEEMSDNVENVRNWPKRVQPGPGFKTDSDKSSELGNFTPEGGRAAAKNDSDEVRFYVERLIKSWNSLVGKKFSEFLNGVLESRDDFGRNVGDVFNEIYSEGKRLEKCTKELFANSTRVALVCPLAMWRSVVLNSSRNSAKMSYVLSRIIHNHLTGRSHDYRLFERVKEVLMMSAGAFSAFEQIFSMFLSERLLSDSTVSLKLEIETCASIQSCFPDRGPLNMLRDVKNSKDLTQRCARNYLENCDYLPADSDHKWKNYELQSSGNLSFYVLWPGWHFRPHSGLPPLVKVLRRVEPDLETLLSIFEVLCRAESLENANRSLECDKSALSWTWLGSARLRDLESGVDLRVSTLQMLILLHFNHDAKVDVSSFVEHKRGKKAVEELLEKKVAFLGGDFLTLNDAFENDVDCIGDDITSFRQVDDIIGRASDARAAMLSCAVVRIAKQEVTISYDLLIERVIKYCQESENRGFEDHGGQFLPGVKDVRDWIERLVNLEYLSWSDGKRTITYNVGENPATADAENNSGRDLEKNETGSKGSESAGFGDKLSKFLGETRELFADADHYKDQLTRDDIYRKVNSLVDLVCRVANVNPDVSEALLIEYEWNCDKLALSYFKNKAETLERISYTTDAAIITSECPVCLTETDREQMYALYCSHSCCRACLKSYLEAQLEQDTAAYTNCFTPGCKGRISSAVYKDLHGLGFPKYVTALVRSYVESNRDISWCHNPKGCEKIVCKAKRGKCAACGWQTCFSCSYVEDHQPATCGHLSQWIDDGGYYHCMDEDAQSHHLARLIAKRCPNCHSHIEKNHGCLHMKCVKCRHDFCWRCLQPWRPTHKDYYHCSLKVSKLANAGIRFVEYNKRCQHHNKAKQFAFDVYKRLVSFDDPSLDPVNLKFAVDLCSSLLECRKVLAYSNIFGYYTYLDKTADLSLHCLTLENKTLKLQEFIVNLLLQSADIKFTVSEINKGKILRGALIVNECKKLINSINVFAEQNPEGVVEMENDDNNLEKARPAGTSDTEPTDTEDWSTMDEESSQDLDEDSSQDSYYDDAEIFETEGMFTDEEGTSENSDDDFDPGWM